MRPPHSLGSLIPFSTISPSKMTWYFDCSKKNFGVSAVIVIIAIFNKKSSRIQGSLKGAGASYDLMHQETKIEVKQMDSEKDCKMGKLQAVWNVNASRQC